MATARTGTSRRARRVGEKQIIPDTPERQTRAALAKLQEAEARRPQSVPATKAPPSRRNVVELVPDPVEPAREQAEHQLGMDEALDKLNPDYIQCRDTGHLWQPSRTDWISRYNAYESQLKCQRCSTKRIRWISRTGAMDTKKAYEYPDGYQMKGIGRMTGGDRDKIRLRSILRVAVSTPEGAKKQA